MAISDKTLGMDCKITRRDFIHDSSLLALGMGMGVGVVAPELPAAYYPPTLTGLRGSHPGSFEVAHALARQGKQFPAPTDIDEVYDLVVVGAGISGACCPGRMHEQIYLLKGINTGGYEHNFDDSGPVALVFYGAISPPSDATAIEHQLRRARERMLGLSFEDYEREIRTVLRGMLGPAGFDENKDILAITVNRWPHGYSRESMDLWDPDWAVGQEPHRIASQPHGNITFANADAGASAYTHVAIDQAFRAVNELPAAG